MARILRGEIWWADLEPVIGHEQGGKRPVLVISDETFNARSGTVIAIALTSQPPRVGFPLTFEFRKTILPKPTLAKISQVRTLSVERLKSKLTKADPAEIKAIIQGLN